MPEIATIEQQRINRNDPCSCGSGRKYKKCCLPTETANRPHEYVGRNKMSRSEADKIAKGIVAEINRGKIIESSAQAVYDSREPKSDLIVVDSVQVPGKLMKQLGEALKLEVKTTIQDEQKPEPQENQE